MAKILILFAHPALEKSRVHRSLIKQVKGLDNVYLNDLYEEYPYFDIDVQREQQLLMAHDIIILQHPFYWYSAPAIVKQWKDLVLEHGWAYGKNGNMLKGKKIFNVISAGSGLNAYCEEGNNKHPIKEFLRPFEQTAYLCKMEFLPPFVVTDTYKMGKEEIEQQSLKYHELLKALRDDHITEKYISQARYMNEIIPA